jgi:hypothetical protein
MYHYYYKQSQLCIVYLADVMDKCHYEADGFEKAFRASEWFTRGWTLQELLAPSSLYFWSNTWSEELGTRFALRDLIMSITGISSDALADFKRNDYYAASVLHWASRRVCTREEDQAYSLLGLLDISMPLLYGEGSKAFVRLQQELATTSDDESILSWTANLGSAGNVVFQVSSNNIMQERLFAPSVRCFQIPTRLIDDGSDTQPVFTCTNSWCGKRFSSDFSLKLHIKNCSLGMLELPRPFIMGPQGLYVQRRIYFVNRATNVKRPRDKEQRRSLQFFVMLNVSRDRTADNQLLLCIRPLRGELFGIGWLKKDGLNYALCDRSVLMSRHDLAGQDWSEMVNEYELLILKERPVERR